MVSPPLKFGYYTGWIPGLILLLLGLPIWVSMPVIILGAISAGVLTLIFPPSFGASFWDDKAILNSNPKQRQMNFCS